MPNIHPTISADQLVEYLHSPPTRRHALLERAKFAEFYPDPYAKARELARDVMLGYVHPDWPAITRNMHGGPELARFLSAWERDWTIASVDRHPVLEVAGVQVTGAAPDVLTKQRAGHRTRLGGLALMFERLVDRQSKVRCALMHRALDQLCGPEVVTQMFTTEDAPVVVSIAPDGDAFFRGGPFTVAWRDIEAACDEIRRSWSTV